MEVKLLCRIQIWTNEIEISAGQKLSVPGGLRTRDLLDAAANQIEFYCLIVMISILHKNTASFSILLFHI